MNLPRADIAFERDAPKAAASSPPVTSLGVIHICATGLEASFYVAIDGDRVLGTGAVDVESGQIDAIFVLPDQMGKGTGRRILAYLEDIAIAAGLNLATLNATLNAAPFYRRCGYEGSAAGVYQSPRGFKLDCVPMSKVLGRSTVDAEPSPIGPKPTT